MKSMRVKITGLIVLAVLITTTLLFLFGYRWARDSMSSRMEKDYSVNAEKYAQELTAWVNTNATMIDSLAADITVSGIYNEDYNTFHTYLEKTRALLNRSGAVYDIYFTYPDNSMVCASSFIADGSVDYVHDRDWFTVAAGTGELFYSTPYRDSDSGKPVFTISRGVYAGNVLQGVLAADIFVDVLVEIIRGADVPADSYAFLVDQNLGMVVHPDEAYAYDDVPRGVLDVQDAPYANVVSKVRSGSRETVYLEDYDGVTRGVVVSKMANTGWYVGIATSKAELTQDFVPLFRGFLIVSGVVVLIGCIAAFVLALVLDRLYRRRQEYALRAHEPEGQASPEETAAAAGEEKEPEGAKKAGDLQASGRLKRLVPIALIFVLMVCMVIYTTRMIDRVSVVNIREVGEDRISAAAAELENYLGTAKSTLWVSADTVDHMVRSGATVREILDYIMEETQNQKQHFDVNITGLYGYVKGEYLDGLAWTPPENYDPTRRDWYLEALAAKGEATILSPYVDAQTDDMVISISRMLSSGTDVVSVDFTMNHIQEIISTLQIKEKGYGFIVDRDGLLIAHRDEEKRGRYLTENEDNLALFDRIREVENGYFEITADRKPCTAFVRRITDQWYAVIVVDNAELMQEVQEQLLINVLICTTIFALITLFYLISRRTEKNYSRRIEQLRDEEQRQAYESRALKLEKEAADRANQAKTDFLASMSHEIRTPINAVLGMNEIILRDAAAAEEETDPALWRGAAERIRSCAGNIRNAGSNLLSIINGVLDFSKIEAGEMEITSAEYSLSALLRDVCSLVSFRAENKGLRFSVDVEETLPDRLRGDMVRVRQVLTNLLTNAVKYTEHGSVRLSVRSGEANPGAQGDMTLVVAVEDTGIGIRQEDLGRIFDRFQRLNLEATGTVEGTGLGLAITQKLLSMMGGSIRVDSVYGEGSVFTARIPQQAASPEPVGPFRFEQAPAAAQPYRESFRAPGARILVVDDTRMNLTVAVGLLSGTEIRVDTASGGAEAVRAAASVPYDVIFMDQRMPGMDGSEALRQIREQAGGPNRNTPVVCMTADAVRGARERYIAEGFTDYLSKPIEYPVLEELLKKYLPAGKLVPAEKAPAPAESAADPGVFRSLREYGICPEDGLHFCQGDRDLYLSILDEYARGAGEKQRLLGQYCEAGDWKNYRILVHALKSTSRTVGARSLSEAAAAAEKAAAAEDAETVRRLHAPLMLRCGALAEKLDAWLEAFGTRPRDTDAGDVLEFPPDQPAPEA